MLESGAWLILPPEGGRTGKGTEFLPETSWGDKIRTPRDGIGYLVVNLNERVIPIWIKGTDKVLPIGSFLPRFWRAKISIIIGKAIDFSNFQEPDKPKKQRERIASIAYHIAEEILALSEQCKTNSRP